MWDVTWGPTEPGRFAARLSRFHVRVEGPQGPLLAHLPNSGRLRELLVPGAPVRLLPRSRSDRRTAADLLLVALPEDGSTGWASVDARLPPRILAAAVARGAIPSLAGYRTARREPRLGGGRADLLLVGADTPPWPGLPRALPPALVETKSITLVIGGAGLFPDSPTARGRRHLSALAAVEGERRVVAFVVQRDDARAVRVNEPADPAFAAALRRALAAGVEVLGAVCRVGLEGIRLDRLVPLEWYSPRAAVTPLPDVVAPGLRLLVVGLNPGHYSAWYGMYFARPANRLWWGLRRAGIVPPTAGPGSEAWLLREHGIGFTDVVKRPTRRAEEVTSDEWAEGARRLRRLLSDLRPGAVCFVGLRGARAVLGPGVTVGPQPEAVAGIPAFVLPSTSPRQAGYPARRLAELFRDLGRWWRTLPLREPSSPRSGS